MSRTFRNQLYLGIGQLLCHASLIYVVLNFSWPYLVGAFFMYFLMTSIGVSITAHRYLAHHSFVMPDIFLAIGSFFFTISMQGSTIAWVAMHREHHRFSDRIGDPHNPTNNFWKTHFLSMFYAPKLRYVLDMLKHPMHQFFHRGYWLLNISWSVMLYWLGEFDSLVYLHLFPAFLCWQGIGIAKTFSHMGGYRNFKTGDNSYNIPVLGYLTFGEAWHNNHHAFPNRISFAHKPWEIDISAAVVAFGIRFLGFRSSSAKKKKR